MTREQILARWPAASESTIARNLSPCAERLPASNPKPAKRLPLERPAPGEAKGAGRSRIIFRIFSRRPCDWDGYSIKELQDCLVHAGILEGDEWNRLEGCVISEKVYTLAEERTEVEIYEPPQTPPQA